MKYKLQVFCPDDPIIIKKIIDAAAHAGAGVMGNYTHTATIFKGLGQWYSGKGAHPTIGKIGTLTHQREVKIEMHCPMEKAKAVNKAIRKAHPYEEPAIEFIKMEEFK